jgi:hypothetical protein
MKRIIKITESDLTRIVKRVIKENQELTDIDLTDDVKNPDKIIKSDLKRDTVKENFRRPLGSPEEIEKEIQECIKKGKDRNEDYQVEKECRDAIALLPEWADLVFGYIMIQDLPKVLSNVVHKVVIASKHLSPPKIVSKNPTIVFHCSGLGNNEGEYIEYYGLTSDEEQESRDMAWLKPFCSNINWKSKVGKPRRLFSKPDIEL